MKESIHTSVTIQGDHLRIRVMRDRVPEQDLLLPADTAEQLKAKDLLVWNGEPTL